MKISVDPINRPIQFSYNFCIRKRKEYRRNSLRLRSVEVQSAKIRMCLRDDVLQAAGSQTPTRQITRIKHTSNFTISGFHTSLGEFMVCEPLVETSHTVWRCKVDNGTLRWPTSGRQICATHNFINTALWLRIFCYNQSEKPPPQRWLVASPN